MGGRTLITVEDANSYFQRYGLELEYYKCDTSLIGESSSMYNSYYDFLFLQYRYYRGKYYYLFRIHTNAWRGNFYLLDENGDYIENPEFTYSYTYSEPIIYIEEVDYPNVTLVLQLCTIYDSTEPPTPNYLEEILTTKNVSYYNHPTSYTFESLIDGSTRTVSADNNWIQELDTNVYAVRFNEKSHYPLDLNSLILTAGKLHEITIPTANVKLEVSYLDKVTLIDASSTNTLTIDLTGLYNIDKLNLKVKVFSNSEYVDDTFNYELPVQAVRVDNLNDLLSEVLSGASVIEIEASEDWTITNLNITSNLWLKGVIENDTKPVFDFDLDGGIIVNEGVTLTLEDIQLTNGNPAILQEKDSKLVLKNCDFTRCRTTNNYNLGSCICCDIDMESLDVINDYTTIIEGCTFINNSNCILHGGDLRVTNSKYHNTDTDYVDVTNPAFLFQVDGTASVTDSVFDINYDDDTFSSSSIMYGQALFMIGSTATINDMTADKIVEDNKVNWCNAPYNNASHLFAKYYYKAIESIVYSSPKLGFEDKNLAYCVSGTDWVFKANTQITKASDGTENRNNKIVW